MSTEHPSRRTLLRTFGAFGAMALSGSALAACGSDSGATAGATGSTTPSAAGGSASAPAGSASASASAAAVNASWPKLTSTEVVVSGFGGQTYEVRTAEQFDPFTKLSGVKVTQADWDYGKFLTMLKSPKPEWDMIDFDGFSIVGLVQGGTAPGKLASWVRRCDLVAPAYQDYCGGSYAYSVVLGWSTSLGATPTSWADFFDTAKFPGKRAVPKYIYAGMVEIALLADGVPKDKIYPLDFDRAFKKLDSIKKDIIFYESYGQGQQYMTQGSAVMIATANSRMIQLKNDGQKVDWTYQDAILYPWGGFALPQTPQHADAANALIDFMSTPEQQALVAKKLYLGPVVSKALDLLTPEELALQPSAPANVAKQLTVDHEAAAKQDADYAKKYSAWAGA